MNLAELSAIVSDQARAFKLVARLRWPNGPICRHCAVVETSRSVVSTAKRRGRLTSERRDRSTRIIWRQLRPAKAAPQASQLKMYSSSTPTYMSSFASNGSGPHGRWSLAISHSLCCAPRGGLRDIWQKNHLWTRPRQGDRILSRCGRCHLKTPSKP